MRTVQIVRVPVLVTEQEKLGDTIPELRKMLPSFTAFKKLSFSCCGDDGLVGRLRELRRKTVIACGIETHICVLQTALDLLERGYGVLLIRDATSSHSIGDSEAAVERMRDAGAQIATTEAAIYELTERAGTEEFKEILEIVKDRRSSAIQRER